MKNIISIIIALAILFSATSLSFASDINRTNGTVTTGEINEKDISKTNIVFQPSNSSNSTVSPMIATNYYVCTVLSTSTDYQTFVRYLTGSWAYASQYVWTESQSTSWGVDASCSSEIKDVIKSQITIKTSYTATYGVGITIPADKSKLSKLGFYSDYTKKYVYTERRFPRGGSDYLVTGQYYNYVYEPTPNTYLLVTYQ